MCLPILTDTSSAAAPAPSNAPAKPLLAEEAWPFLDFLSLDFDAPSWLLDDAIGSASSGLLFSRLLDGLGPHAVLFFRGGSFLSFVRLQTPRNFRF